jgi:hypothetical protein
MAWVASSPQRASDSGPHIDSKVDHIVIQFTKREVSQSDDKAGITKLELHIAMPMLFQASPSILVRPWLSLARITVEAEIVSTVQAPARVPSQI